MKETKANESVRKCVQARDYRDEYNTHYVTLRPGALLWVVMRRSNRTGVCARVHDHHLQPQDTREQMQAKLDEYMRKFPNMEVIVHGD